MTMRVEQTCPSCGGKTFQVVVIDGERLVLRCDNLDCREAVHVTIAHPKLVVDC